MWTARLRANYDHDLEQFEAFAETYGLLERLGFETAQEAWDANPVIQGSTNPADFSVVVPPSAYDLNAVPVTLSFADYCDIIRRQAGRDFQPDDLRPYYHTNTCAGAAVTQLTQSLEPGDIPYLKSIGYTVKAVPGGYIFNDPDGNDWDLSPFTMQSTAWIAAKRDELTRPAPGAD